MNRIPELARLRANLHPGERPRDRLPADASGVLATLLEGPGGPELLLTRRTDHLTSHPGQVSFPGGGMEPMDAGPLEAALRETEEEVGIAPGDVHVLGHLTDMVTHYGRLVCCYVGTVKPGTPAPHIAAPDEVAELLRVPVARFLADDLYEARALPGATPRRGMVHYWHLPQATVWGITGELMARFLAAGWGWAPPRKPKLVGGPEEFPP